MRCTAAGQRTVIPACARVTQRHGRAIACNSYFGKDGLRQNMGGGQGNDLAQLLQQGQALDLGGGATAVPDLGDDDPLNYDPEGLYKNKAPTTLQDGHISRRMAFRNAKTQEEAEEELRKQQEKALAAADKRRAETSIPTDPNMLVEFFLECSAEDIEYFIAKCRDQLNSEFFAALDSALGRLRFLDDPDKDAIAELEGLRAYVQQNLKAQDSIKQGVLSAKEKLQKLLTAPDKKQCILDMAAANEIDVALIQLLQQNIDGATAAGREDVAEFMVKVRDAAQKYLIIPERSATQPAAAPAGEAPQQGAPVGGKSEGPTITIA